MPSAASSSVRIFRDVRGILVESVFWDARHEAVVWVDISAGTVHRGRLDAATDGSDDLVARLPPPVSAVQPVSSSLGGGYIAALKDEIVLLDDDFAVRDRLARVGHRHAGIRFNEGKVDPWGGFVIGSMNTTSDAADGAVYRLDAAGRLETMLGGFAVANGYEWLRDEQGRATGEVLLTDTAVRTVYRARTDAGREPVDVRALLVGEPSDGLALARDGSLWNGLYGGGAIVQWTIADAAGSASDEGRGTIARRIGIPAPNVTSVAFVGAGHDVLLVGSARENLDEHDLESHPLSGGIFRIDGLGQGRPAGVFGEAETTAFRPASTSTKGP